MINRLKLVILPPLANVFQLLRRIARTILCWFQWSSLCFLGLASHANRFSASTPHLWRGHRQKASLTGRNAASKTQCHTVKENSYLLFNVLFNQD
jgi:hypothetical protein